MAIPLMVNLRSLFVRRVSTLTTIVCLAIVAAVFSAMMSLASGLRHALRITGDPLNVMVMREGSTSETNSFVRIEQFRILQALAGVAQREDGSPIATGEVVIIINQNRRGAEKGANILLRGVSQEAFATHPEVRIVEGRSFRPGRNEVIVSRSIAGKFEDCGLGETLNLVKRSFQVVGVFEAGGTAKDSEIWGDVTVVRDTFRRSGYSTAILRAADAAAVETIRSAIAADKRLKLKSIPETQYFADQMRQAGPIQFVGVFLATILAIGAGFGAANTMYAAVSARGREIGTMRAIGFSRFGILVAYVVEALILGAAGGILGTLASWLLLNGVTTGTANWATFSEFSFSFRMTPGLAAASILFAAIVGAVGGLLPARLAARVPITRALRQA